MLTICICVQIKVRTICCERRPSYPPLTSVTRHKFYGGFNSFRDDCYRFWSPQHPRHEQLHGGTRKQINFQAPVLAPGFLLTAPWKYEPDFARNFNDMFELLSVQLCSSSSQTGPRQRQVSFKQKCWSWTLCPWRNMRGIRHQTATWGRNLAFWPQLGATGTLTRGSSVSPTFNIEISTMSPSPWQCCVLLYRPEDMNHVSWLLLICLIECVTEGGGTLGSGDGESPSKCLPLDKTQSWEFYDCLWLLTIRSVAPHINKTENMAASKGIIKMFYAVSTLSFTKGLLSVVHNDTYSMI